MKWVLLMVPIVVRTTEHRLGVSDKKFYRQPPLVIHIRIHSRVSKLSMSSRLEPSRLGITSWLALLCVKSMRELRWLYVNLPF